MTLRTAWNWGARVGLVSGRCSMDGLRYAKDDEKPPFQTRDEIGRQVRGVTQAKAEELWEALYLTAPEVEQLLAHVKAHAAHRWIYPMLATAAHTEARRGELLRIRTTDLDLQRGVLNIRERKRVHGRRKMRGVPLSATLAAALGGWLGIYPGGPLPFAQAEVVGRSRKRSVTTGHLWKDRPRSEAERNGGVRERERPGILPLTENEARHHLKRTLAGIEWEVVRGYHIFRHSFMSA